ncbi:MAG: GNAT family N-acetyltransferase [Deltaproteobacteria bacterium]|nr:GNAT family N-acetyltransferase [Deltaproteobacteria bacterium]
MHSPELSDHCLLRGKRGLMLVPVQPRHVQKLFALLEESRSSLESWLPWVSHIRKEQDLSQLIRYYRQKNRDTGAVTFCIFSDSLLTGVIGINQINVENHSASLGYWLGEPFRGRGIIRESCSLVITYLFTVRNLNKVIIRCADHNRKSRNVAESLGFRREAMLRAGEWVHGSFVDLWSYGLLSREWSEDQQANAASFAADL